MFKENGTGVVSYSNRKLAEMINMPESTIRKNLNSLIDKGYVEIKEFTDEFTGLTTKQKIYNLIQLEQAIVFILKSHDDKLKQHEENLNELNLFKEFMMQDQEFKNKFNEFKNNETRKTRKISE